MNPSSWEWGLSVIWVPCGWDPEPPLGGTRGLAFWGLQQRRVQHIRGEVHSHVKALTTTRKLPNRKIKTVTTLVY